jgi:CubicO group peptidase (beta-lactamase class C family)
METGTEIDRGWRFQMSAPASRSEQGRIPHLVLVLVLGLNCGNPDLHQVDEVMSEFAIDSMPGASVLVVRSGRPIVMKGFGTADLEQRIAAGPATNYRLASLTKAFTAMAVMLQVKDSKLVLDAPITNVLPELPAYARAVTIRHLLTHTSGLWAYEDFVPDTLSRQVRDGDVLEILRKHTDSTYFAPGTGYRYSNTGYALLALAVERTSGSTFAAYLRERIFAPLGMTNTVAFEDGVSTVTNRAYGYTIRDGAVTRTDQSTTSAVLGDGGVYSSVEDLAKWDAALTRQTLVDGTLWREATTPMQLADSSATDYGFGWFIERYKGHLRHRHHGETRGFTNSIMRFPDDSLTVVVLTNRNAGEPWVTAEKIADLFLR